MSRQKSQPCNPPPSGLDNAKHKRSQELARQADFLRTSIIPALMGASLNLDAHIDTAAYAVFLSRIKEDLGIGTDPLENILVEQIVMLHFRSAKLHVDAAGSTGATHAKLYTTMVARLLGELRRMILTLQTYRGSSTRAQSKPRLRIAKQA